MLATLHHALAAYPHHIDGGRPTGREQLVHNDFRSANILHGGTTITAVLDFEDVTYRTRVADLAKATVLLATRYHDWGPTSQVVRDAFVAAYGDEVPLTITEQNELQRASPPCCHTSDGHRTAGHGKPLINSNPRRRGVSPGTSGQMGLGGRRAPSQQQPGDSHHQRQGSAKDGAVIDAMRATGPDVSPTSLRGRRSGCGTSTHRPAPRRRPARPPRPAAKAVSATLTDTS